MKVSILVMIIFRGLVLFCLFSLESLYSFSIFFFGSLIMKSDKAIPVASVTEALHKGIMIGAAEEAYSIPPIALYGCLRGVRSLKEFHDGK